METSKGGKIVTGVNLIQDLHERAKRLTEQQPEKYQSISQVLNLALKQYLDSVEDKDQ
jgi:hypothetical protein